MKVQNAIVDQLTRDFQPVHLDVTNESHMHSVPPGSESHFRVVLVSDTFADKRLVQRHQSVYRCLSAEMSGGVHALALHTYTPQEWQERESAPASPQCLGGSKATG